jgi:hypothetical protein
MGFLCSWRWCGAGGGIHAQGLAMPPPSGHHAQYAYDNPEAESGKYHQHGWGRPKRAKKEIDARFLLVVQRKGKQGEKDGGFQ